MEVVDVRREREAVEENYNGIVALAQQYFGKERIAAREADFGGEENVFYVDRRTIGTKVQDGLEISVHRSFVVIKTHNEGLFKEAETFGKRCEVEFDVSVRLEHNY